MYCYHCAYKLDARKVEAEASTLESNKDVINGDTEITYVCPRCGHLIHAHAEEEDIKSLSRAAHAEIQRARNSFANGMGNLCIGMILLILSIIFFLLAKKPANNFELVTTCAEFYVFIVLLVIAVVLISVGAFFALKGAINKYKYHNLLKDIQNQTFYQ